MRHIVLAVLLGVGLVIGTGAPTAGAHAEIRESTPSDTSEVEEGLDEIRMTFLAFDAEGPVSVEVFDSRGEDHAVGDPVVVARDSSVSQATDPLVPGTYRVHWHALADDGDGISEGDFTFVVVEARNDSGNILILWGAAALVPLGFLVARLRRR